MVDGLAASAPMTVPGDAPAVLSHLEARRAMLRGQEAEIAALRQLNRGHRLREMGFFIAVWMGGMALNYLGYRLAPGAASGLLRIVGTLLTAFAINTFILMLHEGMHNILFASPRWNRWVSVALGVTFLMSFTAYRVMHTRHHQYLGDTRDPDDYRNYTGHRGLVWLLHYSRLLIGVYVYILMIPVLAWRHGSRADRLRVAQEYLVLGVVYAAALTLVPGDLLLYLWFIPLMIAAYMTAVRGLTQHGLTTAPDPYLASRTIQASPLVAFCLLNENYHLEHHLFPEIPSYNLARAHRLIWPRLPRVVTGRSYLAFLFKFVAATFTLDERPIGLTEMLGWEV